MATQPRTRWNWLYQTWQGDLALALTVGAIEIVLAYFLARNLLDRRSLDVGGIGLLAAGAATLLFRRQQPVAALFSAMAAALVYWHLDYPRGPIFLPLIFTFFTVALSGRRFIAWAVLAVGFVSFLWPPYLVGWGPAPGIPVILALAGWLLVLGTAGEVARIQRERLWEARRMREEARRRKVSEERLRIARDLHDVLAHNISLINVQAGVALHLIDEQPEQARIALSAIKNASKDALGELHSVLDMLRKVDDKVPRGPSPGLANGLANLSDLVAGIETAGLKVHTEIKGEIRELPAGIDLISYRILQEGMTNVIRHAQQAKAVTIRLTRGERDISILIEDDGTTVATKVIEGAGIKGMKERAAGVGGTVEAGPRPGRGFRVLARLPISGS